MTDKPVKVEIFGKLRYAKIFEENRDMKGFQGAYEDCNGACTLDVFLDEENAKILKDSGSQKKMKPQEDGTYLVSFERKWEAPYTYGGAPAVARADGTAWDTSVDGLVGNDSTGVVYLTVYTSRVGKGTRLDGVQVIDHVEYWPTGGKPMFKDYSKPAKELTTDEPKPKETKSKKAATKPAFEDDEIPF